MYKIAWDFVKDRIHIFLALAAIWVIYLWIGHVRTEAVVDKVTLTVQNRALVGGQKDLLEAAKKDAVITATKTEIVAKNHADRVEVFKSSQRKVDEIRERDKDLPDEVLAEAQISGIWATWCQTAAYNDDEKGCQP